MNFRPSSSSLPLSDDLTATLRRFVKFRPIVANL